MSKSQFHPFLAASLLAALILSACAPAKPVPTPKPSGVRFESADCMFGDVNGVDCGYLYVPEDRSQPGGAQIQLAVAIIRSSNPSPAPDPLLILFNGLGGPGAYTLVATKGFMLVGKDILANRDVVLFDQRGIGFSSHALECPEVGSQVLQDAPQNLSQEELQRHSFQAYRACHERLVQDGIDLSAYTDAANTADVNDLRVALGYPEWNIYGDAYGARLALRIMRDFPEGVRSVVLDSVYPLEVNLDAESPVNAERALKLLFERCAADKACNTAYPDLETVFYDAATQLDTNPIALEITSPESRQKVTVLINGDRLINLIIQLLHSSDALPYIPGWIYKFYEGNAASDFMLKGNMSYFPFIHEIASEGMGLSIQCSAESNFSSAQSAEAANAVVSPRLQEAINQERYLALCPAWDFEPASEIKIQPVVSNIPTLLLTGDNDPGSSPAWGIAVAKNLSNSYSFEIPWASHGLISYGGGTSAAQCARRMVSAFLADPTLRPDSTCMDKLVVEFVIGH